jgi:hypothetical protein
MPSPDPGLLLLALARRMYEDVKFIAQSNPTQVVDEDTTYIFNHLLNEVRQQFMNVEHVFAFKLMEARTLKYKDALVLSGQLYELMTVITSSGVPNSGIKSTVVSRMAESAADEGNFAAPGGVPTGSAPGAMQATTGPSAPQPAAQPVQPPPAAPLPAVPPQPPPVAAPRPAISQMHPSHAAATAQPPRPAPRAAAPSGDPHDLELYGPKPPKLNEDGTIPFSILDEDE